MKYSKENVELVTQLVIENMTVEDMMVMLYDFVESGISNNIDAFNNEVELLIERGLIKKAVDKP
jgi:hypothetical protein